MWASVLPNNKKVVDLNRTAQLTKRNTIYTNYALRIVVSPGLTQKQCKKRGVHSTLSGVTLDSNNIRAMDWQYQKNKARSKTSKE